MFYLVHVRGRRAPMRFDRLSSAEAYRRVMVVAGKFARISAAPTAATREQSPAIAPVASRPE